MTKKKRPSKELTELERLKRDNAKLRKENDLLSALMWECRIRLSLRQQENPAFLSKQVLKKFTKAGSFPESS